MHDVKIEWERAPVKRLEGRQNSPEGSMTSSLNGVLFFNYYFFFFFFGVGECLGESRAVNLGYAGAECGVVFHGSERSGLGGFFV